MNKKMTSKRSEKIISVLSDYYGDVEPDLKFGSIYQLAVAVVLSAQTTDKQVNSVTGELFGRFPDFGSLGKADIIEVEKIIKSTGFYHAKARNIVNLSRMVTEKFGGELPREMDKLLQLPGVGRKSANVILSIGHGIPGLAVDTHVGRIAKRLGYTASEDPDKAEKDLCSVIPPAKWRDTHLLFIRHGRSLCKARNPECGLCPLKNYCIYYSELNLS